MSRGMRLLAAVVIAGLAGAAGARAEVRPAPLFQDHMVLQQKMPVPVWGTAGPGEEVTVSFAGQAKKTKADDAGKWSVKLDPLPANATPAEMTIAGANTLVVKDVLVGEVWVASGQSNMAFRFQPKDYPDEVAKADRPLIRTFTASNATAPAPKDTVGGAWQVCSPQTLSAFSSVGFFFIKDLQEELKVPVGLLHTSWGGTQGESWVSREALLANAELKPLAEAQIANMERRPQDEEKFAAGVKAWEEKYGGVVEGNKGFEQGWAAPAFDASAWKPATLPTSLARLGLKGGGVVWLRKEVEMPEAAAGKWLNLSLAYTEDEVQIYWNNTPAKSWGQAKPFLRRYATFGVPGEAVKAGRNVVAIRLHSLTDRGQIARDTRQLGIPLPEGAPAANDWLFQAEARFPDLTDEARKALPRPPTAEPQNTSSYLFNAMVNPLVPYAMRGAIWYQGESNAGRAKAYRAVLSTLIGDWRARWGQGDFPFYIVQLANYLQPPAQPVDDTWANLRESQSVAARQIPNAGLAVAIDIGEAGDIHPRNKRDVGHRLALNAFARVYGRQVEYSGPLYEAMEVEGKTIRLTFSHLAGGLAAKGGPLKQFAIAGADKKFVWAEARIEGDTVVVSSPEVAEPAAVRYAWAANPEGCNLYNGAGLPASPFRTDEW